MNKKFLIITIFLILLIPVNGQEIEKCTNKLLEKYPRMVKERAIKECQAVISKINTSLIINENSPIKGKNSIKAGKDIINKINNSIIISKLSRAEIQYILDKDLSNLEIYYFIKEKEQFRENSLLKNNINLSKISKARKEYFKADNLMKNSKNKYMNSRNNLQENKKKLVYCKECKDIKIEIRTNYKNILLYYIDQIHSIVKKSQSRINTNSNFKEEERLKLSNEAESLLKQIELNRNEIESSVNKLELFKSKNNSIKTWKKVKEKIIHFSQQSVIKKLSEVIVRAERLEPRLDLILFNIKQKQVDLKIDDELSSFSMNTFLAKQELQKQNITQNSLIISNKYIIAAHKDLTNILKILNLNKIASKELEKTDEELEVTETAYISLQEQ